MALSAAAVCSYMGAYWFLWQSIVSILVIPVYEKAMYDAIIVVILMILRGILNIASATCSHYLGFRLETNLSAAPIVTVAWDLLQVSMLLQIRQSPFDRGAG